ncbi:MAG: hypothetical protein Q9191_007396, partial [Dirinaria sp. TL-2023a]
GSFTAAQHSNVDDDDELRERMLEHRLANRDDVRDIHIVTALPKFRESGTNMAKKASDKTDLSWAMHWALQVGDQFFELQRGYPDPLRTGLKVSKWDKHQQSHIIERHRQGVTAMTDDEIKDVGEKYFSRLERIDINIYDVWCNNCQIAVDRILRDIGGLSYYRMALRSVQDMVKQFFYNAILSITQMYGRYRGWNEELIAKYTKVLHKTLRVMTSRSHYPKRHWIREDIDAADGVIKKVSTVTDHWILTVLESSLSLRKGSEDLYVRRGSDGKTELNFDGLKRATKGIFDDGDNSGLAWLKAMPWLTAGFLVGTPRWAAAVISIAISRASQIYDERTHAGLKGGLEESLTGLGVSPEISNELSASKTRPKLRNQRRSTNGQRRIRSKTLPIDSKLVARYERCLSTTGVPYFIDHVDESRSWDAPDQQEMCLKITDPPLSKKWEEKQEEGRTLYVNRITGEVTDTRPGLAEIWAVKKKVKPDWVKSTMMALPHGWEMRRTEDGEMFYLNHNEDAPTSTTTHPMRLEIEGERRSLLPEFNVEWDHDRGKKYRKISTGEVRWKAVDGPLYTQANDKTRISLQNPQEGFVEPLPPGWTVMVQENGLKIYWNGKVGKDKIERTTHPLTDKRRRLQREWEMRYTPGSRRYWVHHGGDGRGTTWWTRHRLLKNTSLKNNASGWKLSKNGQDWEWFEGGDVPHSEIPVLDLDDPTDYEFREYPFLLPPRIVTEDGAFIEPLPPNWVRRTHEDGSVYYWNFKDEVSTESHPNDEERRNLPALWEMRFTRHGRQYFVDHDDGSSWWTHPREDKKEQKLRARPGQAQDGWKIAEDSKSWERFEEQPDAQSTEQNVDALSHTYSTESEAVQDGETTETTRSRSNPREWLKSINSGDMSNAREWLKSVHSGDISNPRDWLKSVNSSEIIAGAKTRYSSSPIFLKKFAKSPSANSSASPSSTLTGSPQTLAGEGGDGDLAEKKWFGETPEMTEEPDQATTPFQIDDTEKNLASISPETSSQENPEKEIGSLTERPVSNTDVRREEESSTSQPQSSPNPTNAPEKDSMRTWAKRTTSGLRALRKHTSKNGSKLSLDHSGPEAAVEGLGITTTGSAE